MIATAGKTKRIPSFRHLRRVRLLSGLPPAPVVTGMERSGLVDAAYRGVAQGSPLGLEMDVSTSGTMEHLRTFQGVYKTYLGARGMFWTLFARRLFSRKQVAAGRVAAEAEGRMGKLGRDTAGTLASARTLQVSG